MKFPSQMAGFAGCSPAIDLEHARVDRGKNSGARWHARGQDDVGACPASAQDERIRSGHQPGALRRGTEKKRVRGLVTRSRLIELHVHGGKRLTECAKEMGLSYGRVLTVWQSLVAEAGDGAPPPEEQRRDVRAYCDLHLRHVIQKSLPKVGKGPAHGSVVVAALRELARLHGLEPSVDASTERREPSLADIGAAVRTISPVIAAKMERIEKLGERVTGVGAA